MEWLLYGTTSVKKARAILQKIKQLPNVAYALELSFDFALNTTAQKSTSFRIKEHSDHITVANNAAGGELVIVKTEDKELVLYVSSEFEAGVIGQSLEELLGVLISCPYWKDLLKFSGNGKLETMLEAKHLLEKEIAEDNPEINKARKLIETKLKIKPLECPITTLYKNVAKYTEKITVLDKNGTMFDPLFGTLKIDG